MHDTLLINTLTFILFFFNDTATTEIYTLSLHDALPIFNGHAATRISYASATGPVTVNLNTGSATGDISVGTDTFTNVSQVVGRSEEHTSELQSQSNLVCRLLLEKKKKHKQTNYTNTHKT